jgi:hypothetical protein
VPGAKVSAVDFKVQPVGSGTAGTAPSVGKLLRACGYRERVEATANVLYHPFDPVQNSDDHESVTIKIYQAGLVHVLTGCRGTFQFGMEVGQMPHMDFHFEGISFTYTDLPFPTSGMAFDTLNPPVCLATGCALEAASLNIPSVTLDMAQELTRILSLNSQTGTTEIYISGRMGQATLEPAASLVLDAPNLYTKWAAGSKLALTATIGATAGNIISVACPNLVQTALGFGERDGLLTNTITARMTGPINSVSGTATGGTTTSLVDTTGMPVTSDHQYDGCVLQFVSGATTHYRIISNSVAATDTLSFTPAVTSAPTAGDAYTIHKWEFAIDFR